MKKFSHNIPIEDLEEYGYAVIRNQPCKLSQIVKLQNDTKHGEPGKAKLRWDVVATNIFSGDEVWKGILKDSEIEVPDVQFETFDVSFVSQTDASIELMDENCELVDGIELPIYENPRLVSDIRKSFAESGAIKVTVVETFGKKAIVDYSRD